MVKKAMLDDYRSTTQNSLFGEERDENPCCNNNDFFPPALATKNELFEASNKLETYLTLEEISSIYTQVTCIGYILLETNDLDECSVNCIKSVLNHRKSRSVNPEILDQLKKLLIQYFSAPENLPGLVVVNKEITDDSDFKIGIYSNLRSRLPLTLVASNLELIITTLNQEFPWFHSANTEIYRQLYARLHSSTPAFKLRPLLLAGTPGIGKTSWVKRVAELCNVPFSTVMAAGSADSMYLKGTARGWSSARPGAIARLIATERVANPLVLVDEIDKAATDTRNGSILDVMLQLIEPATNKNYLDECLQVPCDFSWVSWIATCNKLGGLPKPLLDRFTVVLIEKPGPEHAQTIINGSIKAYAAELGIDERMLHKLDGEDIKILTSLSPREINRVVRMMLEDQLTVKSPALH